MPTSNPQVLTEFNDASSEWMHVLPGYAGEQAAHDLAQQMHDSTASKEGSWVTIDDRPVFIGGPGGGGGGAVVELPGGLEKLTPSAQETYSQLVSQQGDYINGLDYLQQDTLTGHCRMTYEATNTYLRTGYEKPSRVGYTDYEVASLDRVVNNAPRLASPTTVYRGVDGERLMSLQPGDSVTDKAFMSTTVNREVAERIGATGAIGDIKRVPGIMRIELPAGTRALAVGEYGHSDELEVLLPRGRTIRVVSVSTDSSGLRIVNGELTNG